jgi:hypothetical protein
MINLYPAFAQRYARPLPSLPVPPAIAIVWIETVVSSDIENSFPEKVN